MTGVSDRPKIIVESAPTTTILHEAPKRTEYALLGVPQEFVSPSILVLDLGKGTRLLPK